MKFLKIVFLFSISCAVTLSFSGCGKNHHEAGHSHEEGEHGHHEDEHGHDEGGAQFKEGKGISLPDETKKVLGLEVAEVVEKQMQRQVGVTLQVYRATEKPSTSAAKPGFAYASGFIPEAQARRLSVGQPVRLRFAGEEISGNGTLIRVDSQIGAATRQAEVVVEIPDKERRYEAGTFLEAILTAGKKEMVTLIPESALLPAAEGNFVYVVNGEFFLRTEVEIGLPVNGFIEVTKGLHAGEQVVSKPVETLWLIELRAVKGGGHSH